MIAATITDLSLPYAGRREKTVRVYVPAHEEGETFPVIYMTDGQNLFEEERALFGSWQTREAAEEGRRNTKAKLAIYTKVIPFSHLHLNKRFNCISAEKETG